MPKKNEEYDKIDKHIGAKIQHYRLSRGMSRQELASLVGVTHQQLQKYEKGVNRISAGRLAALANSLKIPIFEFFKDANSDTPVEVPDQHQRMCMEVARNFMRIKKPIYQDAVNVLVRILAEG